MSSGIGWVNSSSSFPQFEPGDIVKSQEKKATSARTAPPRMTPVAGAARKVVTPRNQWKKGLLNCPWFQAKPIEHESQLEKAFVQRALLCPGVHFIESQPFSIKLAATKYTPDFKLVVGTKMPVVEVKIAKKVREYTATFNEVAHRLRELGIPFYVITEAEIRAAHRDEHAAETLRYAKSQLPFADLARVIEMLADRGPMPVAALREVAKVDTETIQHMVATRRLRCEPSLIVDENSTVSIMAAPADPLSHFEAYFNVKPWTLRPVPALARRPPGAGLKKRPRRTRPILHIGQQAPDASHGIQLIAGGLRMAA
jgi:hypothetical protein